MYLVFVAWCFSFLIAFSSPASCVVELGIWDERARECAGETQRSGVRERLPADSHREGSFVPVSACYDGHFSLSVGARPVQDLVRVAMFGGVEFVGVRM